MPTRSVPSATMAASGRAAVGCAPARLISKTMARAAFNKRWGFIRASVPVRGVLRQNSKAPPRVAAGLKKQGAPEVEGGGFPALTGKRIVSKTAFRRNYTEVLV